MKFKCFKDIKDHVLPILLYISLWGAFEAFLNTFIPEDKYNMRAYIFLLIIMVSIFLLYETSDDDETEKHSEK